MDRLLCDVQSFAILHALCAFGLLDCPKCRQLLTVPLLKLTNLQTPQSKHSIVTIASHDSITCMPRRDTQAGNLVKIRIRIHMC